MGLAILGIALGFTIGVVCRLLHIPMPAPPNLRGAGLLITLTLGFLAGGYIQTLLP
ncbi:XapX domain-containing protein [Roseibium sp. RKSG952]|uniref:XapX domain-containing protein n=1 Tax=Roseibium sp. RKSG952 TaxID=2529384 RepID=UPI0012BD2FE9|nr:XapX domain-containing protein [Roseibium sp. RKSG952]MTH96058.1 XapX domain-containing protein [Roseibium sp. RKSG952]